MMNRKLAMPLLGVLLWVISIHAGTFAAATLLPQPLTVGKKIPSDELRSSVAFGNSVVDRMHRLETNLEWSNVHIRKGTPSHGQLIVSSPEQEALKQGRDALVVTKATIHLVNNFCNRLKTSASECSRYVSTHSLDATSLRASCKSLHKLCSQEEILSQYRSFDGTCNHKKDGSRGAAFSAYTRLLYPEYLDGVQEPRRSVSRKQLPSPRIISNKLVKIIEEEDSDWTLAVVLWSKFVEHDLSHTATSKMIHTEHTIECCAAGGNHLSPRYIHPFCAPIYVPSDDKYYSHQGMECMSYVRSVPAFRSDCTFGHIEQLNQATHYLDGSQIYGSTSRKVAALRSFELGQMNATVKDGEVYPPISHRPTDDCQLNTKDSVCFVSGDPRVNVHPQLTALYTLWLREHNRIAKELANLNPNWDDEILYQEARKIVIAELQHITYDEWLPQVLGKKFLTKIQKYSEYNEDVNPSVSNSFATASLRVLNSLMEGKLKLYQEDRLANSSLHLRDYFNKPDIIQQPGYLDALIRGLSTQSSQKLDLGFTEDIQSRMFFNGIYGFDIFSLDIQRGRDHGLPTYAAYRKLCGLPAVRSFEDLSDVIPKEVIASLSKVYVSPLDIDLIVGGLSEEAAEDSLFGPTLSCIIADQFLRTRRGDRYFYDNENQPAPFSRSQIREIEKVTLARIFCDNTDIKTMQPNVFRLIKSSNNLTDCDSEDIPRLNLGLWMANRTKYY
ncbi:peroxidase, partial [Asbolus verrucosus]